MTGLEAVDRSDAEGHDRLRQMLRAHPGPVVVRTTPESAPPLDRGFATIALPPVSETERAAFWRAAIAHAGLAATDVDGLAAR